MFNKSVFDFSWNCITASASVKRRDQRFRCRSSVSLTHHTEILQERAVCLWSNIRWQKPLLPLLWANEPVKQTQRWCAVDAYEFYLELKKKKIMWVRKELWWWCKWYGALVKGSCTNQCGTRSQCERGQQYWGWKESVPSSMTLKAGVWWHWGEPRILSLLCLRTFWSRLILNMTDPEGTPVGIWKCWDELTVWLMVFLLLCLFLGFCLCLLWLL